jgi:hypothetical protein
MPDILCDSKAQLPMVCKEFPKDKLVIGQPEKAFQPIIFVLLPIFSVVIGLLTKDSSPIDITESGISKEVN